MKQFKSVLFLGLGLTVFCVACIAFFGKPESPVKIASHKDTN